MASLIVDSSLVAAWCFPDERTVPWLGPAWRSAACRPGQRPLQSGWQLWRSVVPTI